MRDAEKEKGALVRVHHARGGPVKADHGGRWIWADERGEQLDAELFYLWKDRGWNTTDGQMNRLTNDRFALESQRTQSSWALLHCLYLIWFIIIYYFMNTLL